MSKDNQKRIVSKCCGKCIKHPESDLVCKGFCPCHHKPFEPKEEVEPEFTVYTSSKKLQESAKRLGLIEEVGEPIGTDCQCDLGSEKHYHPDCEYLTPPLEVKEECQCKGLIPKNTNIVHTPESCGVKSPTEEQLKHFWSKDIEKCPCGGDRDKSGKCTKEVIDLDTSEDIEKEELIEKLAMAITHSEQGEYAKNERFVRDLLSQQEAKIEHCSVEDCPECNIGAFKAGEAKIKRELVEKFESMINSEEQLCGMSKNQAKEVIMNLRTQLSKLLSE